MKERLIYSFILIILINFCSTAQSFNDRRDKAMTGIDAALETYDGGIYERVGNLVDVDSSINDPGIADGNIYNPYNTLTGCFLFMAKTIISGKYVIGVYKKNSILWISDTLAGSEYYDNFDNGFLASMDLNKQGDVDIAAYFSDRSNPPVEAYLWIYSWDGKNGKCINEKSSDGETEILSSGGFDIYDINSDGIDEILASSDGNKMNIDYSWNGSLYGSWANTPALTDSIFTPADLLSAVVSVKITQSGSSLNYSYSVTNNKSSKQKLESIYIYTDADSIGNFSAPDGWSYGKWDEKPLADFFTSNEDSMLSPGLTLDNLNFTTRSIPVFTSFFVQGPHIKLDFSHDSNSEDLLEELYDDILNNSYKGTTLGPGKAPSVFAPLDFLDTLISYKHRAVALGWINNNGVANSLDSKLDVAKKQLVSGNNRTAVNTLNAFLNEVEAQNGKHLTSDAYALLKFNVEYLIGKLQ